MHYLRLASGCNDFLLISRFSCCSSLVLSPLIQGMHRFDYSVCHEFLPHSVKDQYRVSSAQYPYIGLLDKLWLFLFFGEGQIVVNRSTSTEGIIHEEIHSQTFQSCKSSEIDAGEWEVCQARKLVHKIGANVTADKEKKTLRSVQFRTDESLICFSFAVYTSFPFFDHCFGVCFSEIAEAQKLKESFLGIETSTPFDQEVLNVGIHPGPNSSPYQHVSNVTHCRSSHLVHRLEPDSRVKPNQLQHRISELNQYQRHTSLYQRHTSLLLRIFRK